jgi:hypothetical protein
MQDLFEKVRELKTKAKNRRDLERYNSAASFAKQTIQTLESALGSPEATEKSKLADQLADSYGLLGGIYRHWGLSPAHQQERKERLKDSFDAYNTGYEKYEEHEEYKIANSYNRLNRLVSYLLFNPTSFSVESVTLPDGRTMSMNEELKKAGVSIDQQIKLERRGDIWAIADLALVNLLLGRETPVAAYADFISASPADYVYDSVLSIFRELAKLDISIASKLQDAVKLLECELEQLRPAS